MCYCTPSLRTPWCNRCGPIVNTAPVHVQSVLAQPMTGGSACYPYVPTSITPSLPTSIGYYPNKYVQTEVTPKMVEAGLAVFHKTYLDRDTQLIAVYRAMHEARATTA